jgi:hypothetical protein
MLDLYNASGTVLNTTDMLLVDSIDITNKTITVSGSTADITAIDAYLNGTGGHYGVIRFYTDGSGTADEMPGIDKIILNTGTLFGIDAGVYSLWKANTYAVSAALSLDKLQNAAAIAAQRGLSQDVQVFLNPSKWVQLSTEQNAYRMYDSSYTRSKAENGTESLKFCSQNGSMEIFAHKYVKEGEAFMLPLDTAIRVGSTDMTLGIPGTNDSQILIQNPLTAGYSFRLYSQQGLLLERPAYCVKLTGIS